MFQTVIATSSAVGVLWTCAAHAGAAGKHLRGDVYEVRADAETRSFRVLFSCEGKFSQVLLSLSAFVKKTQKTPRGELELAEGRLREWRARGRLKKPKKP